MTQSKSTMLTKSGSFDSGDGLSSPGSPAKDQPPKLTIDQKRTLTLEWFKSNESIRDFRAGEKGVPRPFIRKAAKALDLEDLRKKEGCMALAEDKIMSFRPGGSFDQKKKPKNGKTVSPLDEKRRITLEWFLSDASSIREFRSGEKNVPRGFIRKATSALDLIELKKKRDQDGVMEVVEGKIKNFRPGRNEPQERKAAELEKATKPVVTLDEKRSYVLEWFASDAKSIRDFRPGEKIVPRHFIRVAANALGLKELRKKRGEAGVSEDVEAKIKVFDPKKHQASKPAKKAAIQPINPQLLKALVMEWFDDPEARSVPRFLKDKGEFEAKGEVWSVVKATPLRKLRKQRQEPGVREEAAATVVKALGEAEVHSVAACEMKLGNLEIGTENNEPQQGMQLEASEQQSYEDKIKTLVQQWYDSEKMKSIDRVLQENNAEELKNVVVKLITKNGLRKLRKERENPEAREKAGEKINGMFSPDLSESRSGTKKAPGARKGKKRQDETPLSSSRKERLQLLLLDFFHDDEMLSLTDFLERRGEVELHKEMVRLVRKLRLNKLKRQRVKIKQTATSRIENAFGGMKTTHTEEELKTEQESSDDGMDVEA